MASIADVKIWIETLNPHNQLAVDDGGLRIVELTPDGEETGSYFDLGGIPNVLAG